MRRSSSPENRKCSTESVVFEEEDQCRGAEKHRAQERAAVSFTAFISLAEDGKERNFALFCLEATGKQPKTSPDVSCLRVAVIRDQTRGLIQLFIRDLASCIEFFFSFNVF